MAIKTTGIWRVAILLLGITTSGLAQADAPSNIPAKGVADDLRLAIETVQRIHPDLGHSVNFARLQRRASRIERGLDQPMDQAQAWAALAQLNPVLADGHLQISLPDWREQAARDVSEGRGFFPFEVHVDGEGRLQVLSLLGGGATPDAGAYLARINGRDTAEVVRELLARAPGDTARFRTALLSQRWWLFHATILGSPAWYELAFENGRGERIAASHQTPAVLQRETSFEQQFQCEVGGRKAVLTVGSFYWPDKARFFSFTHDCFEAIAAAGSQRLVIDIRNNGGGDDDMWRDGLLRYIADRPYRHGSRYIKRVLESRPGEVVGQRVTGSIETEYSPPADEPLRFTGEVYVLIGPHTYSSAVLFANVVQDYGFATVAGTGNAVRTRQTGGVRTMVLPNTGLVLSYPRFVLDRPSGKSEPALLTPDVEIPDNPLEPRAAVEQLMTLELP